MKVTDAYAKVIPKKIVHENEEYEKSLVLEVVQLIQQLRTQCEKVLEANIKENAWVTRILIAFNILPSECKERWSEALI